MKNKTNRLLGVLLALVMLVGLVPVFSITAAAEDDDEPLVSVNDILVTDANKNDVLNDGGKVKYDRVTNTLTVLDGAELFSIFASTPYNSPDFTIVAPDGITMNSNGIDQSICVYGSLRIYGDLTMSANAYDMWGTGVDVMKDLFIDGDVYFTNYCYSTLVHGNVEITGNVTARNSSSAVLGKNVTIGGNVDITTQHDNKHDVVSDKIFLDCVAIGTQDMYDWNYGTVRIAGDVTIDATQNRYPMRAGIEAAHIFIGGDVNIKGGNGLSNGIFAQSKNYTFPNSLTMLSPSTWEIDVTGYQYGGLPIVAKTLNLPDECRIIMPESAQFKNIDSGSSRIVFEADGVTRAEHIIISPGVVIGKTFKLENDDTTNPEETFYLIQTGKTSTDSSVTGDAIPDLIAITDDGYTGSGRLVGKTTFAEGAATVAGTRQDIFIRIPEYTAVSRCQVRTKYF